MSDKPKFEWEICKPCWELHYCPYGSLVEFYPLVSPGDIDLNERQENYERILAEFSDGFDGEEEAWEFVQLLMYNDPLKWKDLAEYDTSGMNCNVFGHTCPVFFTAYGGVTETKEKRRPPSRSEIPALG